MAEPADKKENKKEKEPDAKIIDWLTSLKEISERMSTIVKPLPGYENLVNEAVLPLSSAGSQASQFLSNLKAGIPFNRTELWDFASGSNTLRQVSIDPSYLKREGIANYRRFFESAITPAATEGKEIALNLGHDIDADDASEEMQDFHESLGAAQFVAVGLEETAKEVAGKGKNLLSRIEAWLGSISENIRRIKDRIGHTLTGTVGKIADEVIGALNEFTSTVKGAGAAMVSAFSKLCRLVGNLLLRILSGIFDFIRRIQGIARDKGFPLTDVTLELEGAGVDVTVIAGFPIPIPKLKPPKITMKFGATKS